MNADDERLRRKELELADAARRLVESDAWKSAYERLMERYLSQMMQPSLSDDDLIETKRRALALAAMRDEFGQTITTGEMAAIQLERDR